ncbi:MAG: UvrD-helicase domain-containing protein [Nakamurella sp.]
MTGSLLTAAGNAFDFCGPLPTGTTVLEASAGTGKTHAIGALVTRYVADGVALDELLVVTFGRAASQELRERVRGHLVKAERALADPKQARSDKDPVHQLLAEGTDDEVSTRRERLRAGLAGFDAATIVTTHQFCQYVLTGLGIAGDGDTDVELVESLDDLIVEVVDDLYIRAFARPNQEVIFGRDTALALARQVINDPQARLVPTGEAPGTPATRRVGFGKAVRKEVDRRKRERRILGYDDLLSRLATALEPADAPARDRMRARWSTVLVDEFQDTDPVQWQILERAFRGHATMVLVGDPKQSIYAFRGGDIDTYLAAARTADHHETLTQNWRTDAPLVDALQILLGGLALGNPEIPVRPVTAEHQQSRLVGAPSGFPLRLRVLRRDALNLGRAAKIPIDRARKFVARDLTIDIAELLTSGATFDGEPVQAKDIAVIVSTHAQGNLLREELSAAGIPAVVSGNVSVFHTQAGDDWQVLLEALEQPHRSGRVRAAALTPFVGRTATELAAGDDSLTDELSALFSRWATVFTARGVAALLEVAATEQEMAARLLSRVDGERRLTDLRHVGQALHAATLDEGLGLSALTDWLRRRRADSKAEITTDRVRRLDTDAAATQVVTLHASKGLQYPVVYLPFAFDRYVHTPDTLLLHEQGHRVQDIGGFGTTGREDREIQALAEDAGEALRHLYVGLTRAQSQVVTWWAPTANTNCSGLHRVLFGKRDIVGGVPDLVPLPSDDIAARELRELEQRGALVVEKAALGVLPQLPPLVVSDSEFAVGVLDRDMDSGWRRVSYSSLSAAGSAGSHGPLPAGSRSISGDAGVGSEPEQAERQDELIPPVRTVADGDDAALLAVPSPMADLPFGATFGTLVHAVFETTDPQAPDLLAELRECSVEQIARRGATFTAEQLASSLLPVLRTPLGPLAGGVSLSEIPVSDRLPEMDFEIPLAGGDHVGGPGAVAGPPPDIDRTGNGQDPDNDGGITLGQLAPIIRRHLSPADPLYGYAERLASPGFAEQPLRGYLTGSLDAVLRVPGPRYLVVDYKTNWLGDPDGEPLSAWHYRPAALNAVMAGSDYPLQAMLYSVALHRFLRWRQPGYDPAVHIGGVLYLFVRGMSGPATPLVGAQPCGVFGWQPPVGLVTGLSDLLDGSLVADPTDGSPSSGSLVVDRSGGDR